MVEQPVPEQPSSAHPVPTEFTPDQLAYIDELAATITATGVPRMASRVYAAILISEQGSMTAADLVSALQISPAAVSSAVRWLSQIAMISRRALPGTRREQYVVDNESLIRLLAQDTSALRSWITGFSRGVSVVEPNGPAAQRLGELQEFFEFLLAEMDGIMQRWYAQRGQSSPSRSARKR